ncbi:MAG: outer membrane protein assembly factor BamD [Candidatus Acidiferrales bacterium]
MKPTSTPFLALGALAVVAALAGCHAHKHEAPDISSSAEPDKLLYDSSVEDIKNKRFDVARLTLQTLINAYPDSEYLPAAKLAVADSYFQEGTTSALTGAEVEYKDFITFFPNAPEAAFAQYRAALCNYRRLEKPDRERVYGVRAERELQLLLLNYPQSEYAADGEKKLIAVQEVLAEGEFRVAYFYYKRQIWRAAAQRLTSLIERYPNYSNRDQSLWMLGQSYEQELSALWSPDPKRAAEAYARLVREHPNSKYAPEAKEALGRLGQTIPEPDPVLLARAQTVQPVILELKEESRGLLGQMFTLFGLFSNKPDISSAAARLGPPPLEAPQEVPKLPPPPLTLMQKAAVEANVQATTVSSAPGENITSAQAGSGQPAANTQGQSPQAQSPPPPPKKKKSFWRKIIPWP